MGVNLLELYLNSAFCEEHVLYYSAKAGKGLFAKFTTPDLKELPVPKFEIIGEERLHACSDVLGGVRSDSNNEVLRAEIVPYCLQSFVNIPVIVIKNQCV